MTTLTSDYSTAALRERLRYLQRQHLGLERALSALWQKEREVWRQMEATTAAIREREGNGR